MSQKHYHVFTKHHRMYLKHHSIYQKTLPHLPKNTTLFTPNGTPHVFYSSEFFRSPVVSPYFSRLMKEAGFKQFLNRSIVFAAERRPGIGMYRISVFSLALFSTCFVYEYNVFGSSFSPVCSSQSGTTTGLRLPHRLFHNRSLVPVGSRTVAGSSRHRCKNLFAWGGKYSVEPLYIL